MANMLCKLLQKVTTKQNGNFLNRKAVEFYNNLNSIPLDYEYEVLE